MKFFFLLTFLISFVAHASYNATFCSNSTGAVKWETGHNSNTISIKHYADSEQVLTLPIFHVSIKSNEDILIKQEERSDCGYFESKKVFVQKAIITPSPEYPEALDPLSSDKKIETEVICTYTMNSRTPCQKITGRP